MRFENVTQLRNYDVCDVNLFEVFERAEPSFRFKFITLNNNNTPPTFCPALHLPLISISVSPLRITTR